MVTSTVIVSDELMVKTSWWEQTTQSRKDVKSLGTPCVQATPLPRKNVKYFMYHFKKCLQKLFNLNDLSTTRGAQLQLWNDRWHIWMNISVEEIKANTYMYKNVCYVFKFTKVTKTTLKSSSATNRTIL